MISTVETSSVLKSMYKLKDAYNQIPELPKPVSGYVIIEHYDVSLERENVTKLAVSDDVIRSHMKIPNQYLIVAIPDDASETLKLEVITGPPHLVDATGTTFSLEGEDGRKRTFSFVKLENVRGTVPPSLSAYHEPVPVEAIMPK